MAERARSDTIQLKARMKEPLRAKLEEAAETKGVSLNAEMIHRLEQSFSDDAALIEAFGGRDTYDVLRVMGSVAAHIQTRKGKTVADWKIGVAVGYAWKRLIHDWVSIPSAKWIAELERLSDDIPDAPVPPKLPKEPIRGGLLVQRAPEEEWKAYKAERQDFKKKADKYFAESAECKRIYDQNRAVLHRKLDEFRKAVGIGEEALGLLSDQEK